MKRYNDLFRNTIDVKNIDYIYKTQIKRNTKNKIKLYKFEEFYIINIANIIFELKNDYKVGKYNIFLIKDPKYRIIMSQSIKDKLINHVCANSLIKVLEPSLINTNVATRKGKGTLYGIKLLKKYLNELKGNNVYALKFDINKFFYNIDHNILKKILRRKIKDKRFLNLIYKIIDSTNTPYINKNINILVNNEINRIKKSNVIEKTKVKKINNLLKIPFYKRGKGLPIGNMTSQIMAIFYLNELDHFIIEKLKVRYIRYMDDGILLSNDKQYLKYCLKEIKLIIDKYKLNLNSKTNIININKNGIDFLGFNYYIYNNKIIMKIRGKTKRKFKRKIKLIKKGKINYNKQVSILSSYRGLFKWGNCNCLFYSNLK